MKTTPAAVLATLLSPENHLFKLSILLLASVLLASCNRSEEEDLFSVSVTLSGETPVAQVLVLNDLNGNVGQQILTADSLGKHTFETALPANNPIEVVIPPADEDQPACRIDQNNDLFIATNIGNSDFNLDVTCHPSFTVSGEVTGLPDGETMLLGFNTGLQPNISSTDTSFADHSYINGDSYEVSILQPPANPEIECEIFNGTGVIDNADVDNVEIKCGIPREISVNVDGLVGGGLVLALDIDQEFGGVRPLLDAELLPIAADGIHQFNMTLTKGDFYQVRVSAAPTNPDQRCLIENESGFIEDEDITNIEVNCPSASRTYFFDDIESIFTRSPELPYGEPLDPPGIQTITEGVVHERYDFLIPPSHNAIDLGAASGLDGLELFDLYFNDNIPSAVVHSSAGGETYWLAVEVGNDLFHRAELHTTWRLRKESNDAKFSLIISQINMLGFSPDKLPPSVNSDNLKLLGFTSMDIHAHHVINDNPADEAFYDRSGFAYLLAKEDTTTPPHLVDNLWQNFSSTKSNTNQELWSAEDFEIDENLPGAAANWIALMTLKQPIVVDIDLSDVPLGGEFIVVSDAAVTATNFGVPESGMAVYLRDPAGFDPGIEPEFVSAGVMEMEGVKILPADDLSIEGLSGFSSTRPPICGSPGAEQALLQFSASEYHLHESEIFNVLNEVRVSRQNSSVGLVTAQVSVTGDSAVFGEDFDVEQLEVRFGDGSSLDRTLDFGIIDDSEEENDETFTISLHSPEGCAVIGAQDTATVTILANDPAAGTVSFANSSYLVNEAAGELEILVERLGGEFGILAVRINTADGSALANAEYGAITSQLVVFGNGDTTPKSIQIPILDDSDAEPEKSFSISITADDPAIVGTPDIATITIVDNDLASAGEIAFSAPAFAVSEGAGQATVSITRRNGSAGEVSVLITTTDDTAVAVEDYQPLIAEPIIFADGDATDQLVNILIVDDAENEGEHRFNVNLSGVTGGATIGLPFTAAVIIEDNDGVIVPPVAPLVNANANVKTIELSWAAVADVTHYRLLQSTDGGISFDQFGGDIDIGQSDFSLPVAVHLFDWQNTQYILQSCNSAGCTDSSIIDVQALMLGAIGFFKASNTEASDFFGSTIAVSGDGLTIAVTARHESSQAQFINGDQTDNSSPRSGAVYVFHEDASGWQQQAYVKASNTTSFADFGHALALSEDGNTLMVGAPAAAGSAGSVYVYVRNGGIWQFSDLIGASNAEVGDLFGTSLALNADASRLVVGATGEAGNATGVNGDEANNDASEAGAVYVFDNSGGIWSQAAYIKASNTETDDRFGYSVALSGDGNQLAVGAFGEDSLSPGINGDETDNSGFDGGSVSNGTGAVYAFSFTAGQWQQDAYIKSSNIDFLDGFGQAIALDFDGNRLIIGAAREDSSATGIDPTDEADNSADGAGAVYMFERNGVNWSQTHYIKPSNGARSFGFGIALDITDDGISFVVTAPGDESLSTGVNGDQSDGGLIDTGAAYLFQLDLTSGFWQQRSYIKPSNTDLNPAFPSLGRATGFGFSTAISGNAGTLAIGALSEESGATGINGDQADQSANGSGAAYVY